MNSRTTVFLGGIAAIAISFATLARAEPLPVLIPDLLDRHPQIRQAQEGFASRRHSVKEAFAGYLPNVNAQVSSGYATTDLTETTPPGVYNNAPTQSHSLNVTQNVFDGRRTTSGYRYAQANLNVSAATLEVTRQQILFEGISTYFNIMRQVEINNLSIENITTLKKQLHLEDERVKRGSGIAVDVLQAKSRLQIAMERYTAFQGALKDAVSRFAQVYDREPVVETMRLPDIPYHLVPEELNAAIDAALAQHPALKGGAYNIRAAGYNRGTAKAGYYPSVNLVSAGNYDNNVSGVDGTETRFTVTGQMSWNLFNGFADKARVGKAAHDFAAANEAFLYQQRKTAEEVKLAWSALTTSQKRLDLLENAVNIAGEVYDARKKLRDAGKETVINLLDAENELFRAKIDASSARYDYYTAVYRVLQSMGQLEPEVVK